MNIILKYIELIAVITMVIMPFLRLTPRHFRIRLLFTFGRIRPVPAMQPMRGMFISTMVSPSRMFGITPMACG